MTRSIMVVIALLVVGCASSPSVQLTPLEIQALQTREFETDKHTAFASTVAVFQDLGYIIESADESTGFVTAASPTDAKFNWWTWGQDSSTTQVTSFIEELRPGFTRVRVTFVNSLSKYSSYGKFSEKDNVILESGPYQAAFERISNEIFVREGSR